MTVCEHLDAVVARHLDGDVAGPGPRGGWQSDALADHLRDCAACQQYLQRARRLDAVLAEVSGRTAGELAGADHLERLLQRAMAVATPPRVPARRPVPAVRLLLAALGLVALGFVLALLLAPRPPAPPAAPRAVVEPVAPTGVPPAPAAGLGIPIAQARPFLAPAGPAWASAPATSAAALPGAPRTRGDVDRLCAVLADRDLPDRLRLYAALPLLAAGVPLPVAPTAAAADAVRQRCSELLLDAPQPYATDAWLATVATLDQGPLLDAVLADARKRAPVVARLRARLLTGPAQRQRLDDLACLTMAARLGGRDLDGAVRAFVRGDDALAEVLAAALRTPFPRPGRAALLLDVSGDLVARGAADDERLARALFAGQPAAVVPELLRELQQSGHSPRRVRCLLALGAAGAAAARPALLQALHGPALTEALAAAYALGGLGPAALAELAPQAERGPRAWLLRAALCHAGVPRAQAWIDELELSTAERELLGVGGFTFAQFPVFAALLRECAPATY